MGSGIALNVLVLYTAVGFLAAGAAAAPQSPRSLRVACLQQQQLLYAPTLINTKHRLICSTARSVPVSSNCTLIPLSSDATLLPLSKSYHHSFKPGKFSPSSGGTYYCLPFYRFYRGY